ncbi:hypothetical protein BVY02_01250 [bacterium J17]|nr:hypothetical protein BVY02_01250 [bacterium J17]
MVEIAKKIVGSKIFNAIIVSTILLAAVLVGVETYPEILARHAKLIIYLDVFVLTVFATEIAIRMAQYGAKPWRYFKDGWNIFDFVIVGICFLPLQAHFISVLRLARILRVLRIVSLLPRLQVLVGALLESIPSIGYVTLLLALHFYIYSVAGVFLFGENDPVHFESLPIAMVTLFRVVTLEDWTDIMYIQMYGSDKYGYGDYPDIVTSPVAYPIVSPIFFISFVLLGTMIILNLFVGVIINGMAEIQTESEIKRLEENRRRGYLTISDEVRLLHYQIEELGKSLKVIQVRLKATDDEVAKEILKYLEKDKRANHRNKASRSERITLLKANEP